MFVALPRRQRPSLRWACPLLFGLLWLAFFWYSTLPPATQQVVLQTWGALDGGPGTRLDLQESLEFAEQGKVAATVATDRLENINRNFEKMHKGQIEGRIVLDLAA